MNDTPSQRTGLKTSESIYGYDISILVRIVLQNGL